MAAPEGCQTATSGAAPRRSRPCRADAPAGSRPRPAVARTCRRDRARLGSAAPDSSSSIPPGVCRNRLATPRRAGVWFPSPEAPGRQRGPPRGTRSGLGSGVRRRRPAVFPGALAVRRHPSISRQAGSDRTNGREAGLARGPWGAAGFPVARQLRDLAARHLLVEVDDQRFRIAVPNGFAKDWLETRYRSLISQTLARVVGYSVQVEFVVAGAARPRSRPPRSPRSPSASSPRGSARPRARPAARPTSTPATPSRTSSSGRPTASPTRRRSRSRSARATPTTRCSSTAASASARPT